MRSGTARAALTVALAAVAASACTHKSPTGDAANVVVVTNLTPDATLSPAALASSAAILQRRLHIAGVGGTVTVQAQGLVAKTPAGSRAAVVALALQRGVLRLRPVLAVAGFAGRAGTGAVSASDASTPDLAVATRVFARLDCAADQDPTDGLDPSRDYIVGCDTGQAGTFAYLMGPAGVQSADVVHADALVNPESNDWGVAVQLNGRGAMRWLRLTAAAARKPDIPQCSPPQGCNAIAIVIDGVVMSAPRIVDPAGIAGGQFQLFGAFTHASASRIAAVIGSGELPARFTQS